MREFLDKMCEGRHLDRVESKAVFQRLVNGELSPVEIAALLVALRVKGEQPDEIAGAAEALCQSASHFPSPAYAFADSCGTGGDGGNTINISTTVALVAAELGIPVAKHGNRSVSSQCGSADVLESMGVKIDISPEVGRRCLDEVGICFLFAPQYHMGLRHAGLVRQMLKVRTIFNILGPLVNPARPQFQIVGVYDPQLCVPLARTLGMLGLESAMVVHGDGLDEVAIHATTHAALLKNGDVTELTLSPESAGLSRYPVDQLKGDRPRKNAELIEQLLKGDGAPAHVASVAINVGALAWVFGKADNLAGGAELALEAIGSGRCYERLKQWSELSHGA